MYNKKLANYYDEIYENKNYLEEVKYIEKAIENYNKVLLDVDELTVEPPYHNMIDIGSGTGNHALIFAKRHLGFNVWGIEPSKDMYQKSIEKLSYTDIENCMFLNCFLDKIIKDKKFFNYTSVVTSLFHVINHINTFDNLQIFIDNVSKLLKKDGLFIFDCWNKKEVIRNPPKMMVREHYCKNENYVRIKCEPTLDIEKEIVNMKYKYFISSMNEFYDEFETELVHKLWDDDLLTNLLNTNNFEILQKNKAFEFECSSDNAYKISFVARKI